MVNILIVIVPAYIVLCALHLLYESVYAPLLRQTLKYRLLVLGDRLAQLRENVGITNCSVFDVVEGDVDFAVKNLMSVDVVTFYRSRILLRRNAFLRARISERYRHIDECDIPEVRQIVESFDRYLFKLLLVNCGGFFFWTWPVFLVLFLINKIQKVDTTRILSLIRSVFAVRQLAMG